MGIAKRAAVAGSIGARIRLIREAMLLSREGFAERIGVRFTTVYRLETGRALPSVGVLAAIGQASGVSLDWLVVGRGKPGRLLSTAA